MGQRGSAQERGSRARETEKRWQELNAPFSERAGKGPSSGPDWLIETSSPHLLVTAVHGVRHVRPGRGWKAQDARTGGLVRALAEATSWSSALVLRSDRAAGDANFDGRHPLKDELSKAGLPGRRGVLLDLHGMADRVAGADLMLGLGGGDERTQAVAAAISEAAVRHGLRVTSDPELSPFTGASAGTMTRWAQQIGAAAVQIEISPHLRFDGMPQPDRVRLVAALLEAMDEVMALQLTWLTAD